MVIASQILIRRDICMKNHIINEYDIHKYVYSLFPLEKGIVRPFLFNDKGEKQGYREIILISKNFPKSPPFGTCNSKKVPEELLNYSGYRFSVKLNPVTRNKGKDKRIEGIEEIKSWFINKAPEWGFQVDTRTLETSPIKILTIRDTTKERTLTKQSVEFSGQFTVLDKSALLRSFCAGIGRGKAFGFGLLEIVPIF
jgi:CRISPR system Cascade subunit CasE